MKSWAFSGDTPETKAVMPTLEHWTLLFEDPSKAKLQDLKSGEFLSVQASKLVQRLNNVAPLSLKSDSPDQVFRLRNRMVHYGPPPQLAVRVELAVGLGFALDFIHKHLLSELPSEEQTELETLKEEITEVFSKLDEFRTDRLAALEAELKTRATSVTCRTATKKPLSSIAGKMQTPVFSAWRLPAVRN